MALRSLIKTESRTAKLRQVDSHCQGLTGNWTSEWMNLSLGSLPLCHFLILSFQVVCFWEKNPWTGLCVLSFYLSSQVSRYLDGSFQVQYPFLPKQTSEKTQTEFQYFVHLLEIVLNIFANQRKEESLATPFFAKHTYLLELHLELNSGSSLHLYRSLSLFYTRCAPFRAWKCSQPRPAALQCYGSPLSAVSSTCKEITRDKCYGSVRLALFTASLTKKCVVWNCALGKWQCLHNETSVTRSIWIQAKATPTSEVS